VASSRSVLPTGNGVATASQHRLPEHKVNNTSRTRIRAETEASLCIGVTQRTSRTTRSPPGTSPTACGGRSTTWSKAPSRSGRPASPNASTPTTASPASSGSSARTGTCREREHASSAWCRLATPRSRGGRPGAMSRTVRVPASDHRLPDASARPVSAQPPSRAVPPFLSGPPLRPVRRTPSDAAPSGLWTTTRKTSSPATRRWISGGYRTSGPT